MTLEQPAGLPEELAARFPEASLLGQGAFGAVFRARDPGRGRDVAVKVLRATPGRAPEPGVRARFLREARLTEALDHPAIVSLLEHGTTAEGTPYLVYEYVEGEDLDRRSRRRGGLAEPEARRIGAALARGLDHAHREGVLHRDVKPANVLVRRDGTPVLCDLGLACGEPDGTLLTAEGALLGTPAFMAPELYAGEVAGPASDQFALAATLYEVLYRRTVYGAEDLEGIVRAASADAALRVPPGAAPRDPGLAAALERALARRPEERFPTMAAFAAALRARGGAAASQEPGPAVTRPVAAPGRGGGLEDLRPCGTGSRPGSPPTEARPLAPRVAAALALAVAVGVGLLGGGGGRTAEGVASVAPPGAGSPPPPAEDPPFAWPPRLVAPRGVELEVRRPFTWLSPSAPPLGLEPGSSRRVEVPAHREGASRLRWIEGDRVEERVLPLDRALERFLVPGALPPELRDPAVLDLLADGEPEAAALYAAARARLGFFSGWAAEALARVSPGRAGLVLERLQDLQRADAAARVGLPERLPEARVLLPRGAPGWRGWGDPPAAHFQWTPPPMVRATEAGHHATAFPVKLYGLDPTGLAAFEAGAFEEVAVTWPAGIPEDAASVAVTLVVRGMPRRAALRLEGATRQGAPLRLDLWCTRLSAGDLQDFCRGPLSASLPGSLAPAGGASLRLRLAPLLAPAPYRMTVEDLRVRWSRVTEADLRAAEDARGP